MLSFNGAPADQHACRLYLDIPPASPLEVESHANLFLKTLFRYRDGDKFRLHAFAIMPDHVHLLLTAAPEHPLPKCIRLIKGGYSFAARKLTPKEIWHTGYHEHRIRDLFDFDNQVRYIANNPPAARLPGNYLYVHTHPDHRPLIDPCPPHLLSL